MGWNAFSDSMKKLSLDTSPAPPVVRLIFYPFLHVFRWSCASCDRNWQHSVLDL